MPPVEERRPARRWWPVLRWALTLAALAGIVYLAVTRPNWDEIGDALAEAETGWIVAAGVANALSLMLRGAGWWVAASVAVDRRLAFVTTESAFQIGQAINTFAPGRVGEPAKCYVLNRRLGGRAETFTALLGSVAAHRLMDVVPLAVVSTVVVLFGELSGSLQASVIATVIISTLLISLAARLATRPGARVRSRRLLELVGSLREGFMVLRRRGPLVLAVLLEGVGWSAQIVVVWLGFHAFGIDAGPVAAAAVVIATNAATLIPLWPGNVGLFQLAVAIALQPWGVPESTGIAFGLALQGAEMLSALALGLVGGLIEGVGLRELFARRSASGQAAG